MLENSVDALLKQRSVSFASLKRSLQCRPGSPCTPDSVVSQTSQLENSEAPLTPLLWVSDTDTPRLPLPRLKTISSWPFRQCQPQVNWPFRVCGANTAKG